MTTDADIEAPEPDPPPGLRKRGRPPGQPKTGGRKKGRRNWTNPEIRDALLGKSDAIEVLADIVAGRQLYCGPTGNVGKAGWRYPTMAQRLQALQILLGKCVPDLRSQELTGKDGERLIPDEMRDASSADIARAVMNVLDPVDIKRLTGKQDSDEPDPSPETGIGGPSDGRDDGNGAASEIIDEPENTVSPEMPPSEDSAPSEKIGVPIPIGYRGAKIVLTEIPGSRQRKWAVLDDCEVLHGFRRERRDAEELAERLPSHSLESMPGPENGIPR